MLASLQTRQLTALQTTARSHASFGDDCHPWARTCYDQHCLPNL